MIKGKRTPCRLGGGGRRIERNGGSFVKRYLAIDIGASSGRHIVGWLEGGALQTEEVYRFPNGVTERDGHLVWDMESLLRHVQEGIAIAQERFEIESFSIDTWAVDYVLMDGKQEIWPCYAYRDDRTEAVIPQVHEKVPFSELYRKTGIQFQPFNTIYQLYADKLAGRLDHACGFLMVPEYLLYKLTGVKSHEYTNATTTGLVSDGAYSSEIIARLGLPRRLFQPLAQPGTVIGKYKGSKAVLCATHDTASAVEGIPMEGNVPYISSGTWSLLGVKTEKPLTDAKSEGANYSNEGGVGYNRYQKNIMGMWLVNRLKDELAPDTPFRVLDQAVLESTFDGLVDANDDAFRAPKSMKAAFDAALSETPQTAADYLRCAYRSLAASYKRALEELEANTGETYDRLYIVGGGAKNVFLNEETEKVTGKKVIALPIEATALGNLKIQMQTAKEELPC